MNIGWVPGDRPGAADAEHLAKRPRRDPENEAGATAGTLVRDGGARRSPSRTAWVMLGVVALALGVAGCVTSEEKEPTGIGGIVTSAAAPPEESPLKYAGVLALPADDAARAIESLLASGRQSVAEALLELLVVRHPNHCRILFLDAACTRSRFMVAQALPLFARVARLAPDSPEGTCAALVGLCDGAAEEAVRARAMDGLRWLAELHRDDPVILWMLAVQCRARSLPYEGVQHYRRLHCMWTPGPVLLHQTFANVLGDVGAFEEALPHREMAVRMEPTSWSLPAWLQTLNGCGRHEEVIRIGRSLVNQGIEDAGIHGQIGRAFYRLGRVEESLTEYARADELEPNTSWLRYGLMRALLATGRIEEAWRVGRETPESVNIDRTFVFAQNHLNRTADGTPYARYLPPDELARLPELIPQYREALETRLLLAASHGLTDLVRTLLEAGIQPTARCPDGCTALHHAAEFGQVEALQLLIDAGMSLTATNKAGNTPLRKACQILTPQTTECVRRLIAAARQRGEAIDLVPAIDMALDNCHVEQLQILLDAGANLDEPLDAAGLTLLMQWSRVTDSWQVRWLLEHGANPNVRDSRGRTPLMYAVRRLGFWDPADWPADTVRALLRAGADPNLEDENGMTALDHAAAAGFRDAVELLAACEKLVRKTPRCPRAQPTVTGGVERVLLALQAPFVLRCGGQWHRPNGGWDRDRARTNLQALYFVSNRAQCASFIAERLAAYERIAAAAPDGLAPTNLPPAVERVWSKAREHYLRHGLPDRPGLRPALSGVAMDLAWQAVQVAYPLSFARAAGWVNRAEAEDVARRLIAPLRMHIRSWDEFRAAFEAGARLWSPPDALRMGPILDLLANRTDPHSPWVQIDWSEIAEADVPPTPAG